MRAAFASVCLASLLPVAALAEPDEALTDEAAPVVYQKVSNVEFDTVNVGAGLVKPGITLSGERKPGQHDSLVLLRENWDAELVESVDQVK
jgi:hypothetical protein